jgi:hypothetical protein
MKPVCRNCKPVLFDFIKTGTGELHMMGKKKEIKDNIEKLRDILNKSACGLTSLSEDEILMISQQLDFLIISYYKIESRVMSSAKHEKSFLQLMR